MRLAHQKTNLVMAISIAAVLTFSPIVLSEEQYFFSVIEDLPLMPHLVENSQLSMAFETSAGRVANLQANGLTDPGAVDTYYKESLPQLGWKLQVNGSYVRGNELLYIKIETSPNNMVKVIFYLRPLTQ